MTAVMHALIIAVNQISENKNLSKQEKFVQICALLANAPPEAIEAYQFLADQKKGGCPSLSPSLFK